MLQKHGEVWKEAGLEIEEEDFYDWYTEIMKPKSSYVIREGEEAKAKKHALAKGKAKVKAKAKVPPSDK